MTPISLRWEGFCQPYSREEAADEASTICRVETRKQISFSSCGFSKDHTGSQVWLSLLCHGRNHPGRGPFEADEAKRQRRDDEDNEREEGVDIDNERKVDGEIDKDSSGPA
jgi:hypothetical protein